MKYDKEVFEEMIRDWQADNAEECIDLTISDSEISEESGEWVAYAEDKNHVYSLTDDGYGNISINYQGTK